jgi:Fe(II)/alpha-ketoglutarate-dependent arginine beta-hydroxylase
MAERTFPSGIAVYSLSEAERGSVTAALATRHSYYELDEPQRVAEAQFSATKILPGTLTRFLSDFKSAEPCSAVVLTGCPVDDSAIGPTPSHWADQPDPCSTRREELFFLLAGSVLGEIFSWSTLQEGHLVQDVLPIPGDEKEQSGHGSDALLEWHTEDGFHPYRCDYLGLMCLRNYDAVPTTFATISAVDLPGELKELLAQPLYLIRPDNEHLRSAGADSAGTSVHKFFTNPDPTPVIFGDLADPYLRIDPYFMASVPGRPDAACALKFLVEKLDENLQDLVLLPGDVCFMDNYRAVHGRRRFRARYNGTDRWLKKIIITRDLRKSRSIRSSATSRVLG